MMFSTTSLETNLSHCVYYVECYIPQEFPTYVIESPRDWKLDLTKTRSQPVLNDRLKAAR